MHGQHDVSTPSDYLAALDEPRRTEIAEIDAFIRATVPDLTPCIVFKILGYGPTTYRDAKGKLADFAAICLSSNKQYISLYVMGQQDGQTIAEAAAARLGKVDVGKACIRFKRFSAVDQGALADLLKQAAEIWRTGRDA